MDKKEELKKTEETTQQPPQAAAPIAETPKPTLAPGLFQKFTLGTTLEQAPTGNVIANIKSSPIDYEKTYKESTKNIQMSPAELKALTEKPSEKK